MIKRPDLIIRNKSLKQRLAVKEARTGTLLGEKTKEKISNSVKKFMSNPQVRKELRERAKKRGVTEKQLASLKPRRGSKNHNWKGNSVGYRCLHLWVERRLGKPKCCDECGELGLKRYHWANKSGKYKREITDWLRLCPKCHKKYDREGGYQHNKS
jgi:hypothetical protein